MRYDTIVVVRLQRVNTRGYFEKNNRASGLINGIIKEYLYFCNKFHISRRRKSTKTNLLVANVHVVIAIP